MPPNDRFEDLLRRLPSIANAVNAFESDAIQQMAFRELVAALNDSMSDPETQATSATVESAADKSPKADAAATPSRAEASPKEATSTGTQDILALARAEFSGTGGGGNGKKSTMAPKPDVPVAEKPPEQSKPSPVEVFKEESNQLRGSIGTEMVDETDHFGKGSVQLLKHHGTYQQDNRDVRGGGEGKSNKSYMFMVRTRIPSGILTSDQLLAELDLADEFGNDTLRITTRQGLQLHGIVKSDLQHTIQRINEIQLTTLGACGDVERNVMCCPAPYKNGIYETVQGLADEIANHLAPKTTAYHELWVKDPNQEEKELVGGGREGHVIEPIYGTTYLPRKFKTAIGFPHDNCVDLYTHDLGLLAIIRDDEIVGYNLLVGGGQGVTPSAKKTFPALGKKMTFVTPDQVIDVATAIVKVQRDFGNRADRKVARLKYLINNWGLDQFKSKVEEYYGSRLPAPEPEDVHGFNDHIGWDQQGDGKWFYGLNVENGRIKDDDSIQLKSALREICRSIVPGIRLTSHQSLLMTDVAENDKSRIEDILRRHHVKLSEEISTVRRWSMACVAWPTCGLSITEAERALPGIMDQMEVELARLGLSSEKFTVRMTGCPNGCARPYNSDIGLVGKTAGKYTVLIGGRLLGNRLNFVYKDLVAEADIVPTLTPLFVYFKQDRRESETFGDFCARKGQEDLLTWADKFQASAT